MPPTPDRPHFEIAYQGGGVRPDSVPAEDVAKLVLEAVGLLRAVAAAKNQALPPLWLRGVYKGSAAAKLYSMDQANDERLARIAVSAHQAARRRGKDEVPQVREALRRVYGLTKDGPAPIRIAARKVPALKAQLRPVTIAKPMQPPTPDIRSTHVLHGRIVGLEEVAGRLDIKVTARGRGKLKLMGTPELTAVATRRFGKHVRVRAQVVLNEAGSPDEKAWRALTIDAWEPGDALEAFRDARLALAEQGVALDVGRAIASLRDDDG